MRNDMPGSVALIAPHSTTWTPCCPACTRPWPPCEIAAPSGQLTIRAVGSTDMGPEFGGALSNCRRW